MKHIGNLDASKISSSLDMQFRSDSCKRSLTDSDGDVPPTKKLKEESEDTESFLVLSDHLSLETSRSIDLDQFWTSMEVEDQQVDVAPERDESLINSVSPFRSSGSWAEDLAADDSLPSEFGIAPRLVDPCVGPVSTLTPHPNAFEHYRSKPNSALTSQITLATKSYRRKCQWEYAPGRLCLERLCLPHMMVHVQGFSAATDTGTANLCKWKGCGLWTENLETHIKENHVQHPESA